MEIKYNETLKETLYVNKLSSGIKCYIIPKKGYVEKQGLITVNYGSVDNSFQLDGSVNEMPDGIAHFLEHKLFEEKETNVFDRFMNQGATVNAFTNFTNTAYYFNCIDHFDENFKLLLRFTQSPYFTDENVEKEKGIITQEINMYRDDPNWRLYVNLLNAMFLHSPVKKEIAGTVESIGRINKDMLYNCHSAFYFPENMAIVCVGDFDPERVFQIADSIIKPRKIGDLKRLYGSEPACTGSNYIEEKLSVSRPMFYLGYKENSFEENIAQRTAATSALLDLIAGESSALYESMYNDGLIDSSFSMQYICGSFYGTAVYFGSSDDPGAVAGRLSDEIKRLRDTGLDAQRFENIKKKHIGRYIRGFNSIDNISTSSVDAFSKGTDLFDIMDAYSSLNIEYMEKRFHELFRDDYSVLSVVSPK